MTTRGAIRVRLVQMEVLPGQPWENTQRMLAQIDAARTDGVELVAFPEMAVPGYLIGDEWERQAFLRECESCGHRLREAGRGLVVVFGNVGLDWRRRNEDGRVRKYNALFVAEDGRFVGPEGGVYDFVIKTLLPNYREFDDSRHFFDLRKLAIEENRRIDDLIAPVRTRAWSLGGILCEDAWDADYAISPLRLLARRGVDLLVNLSCSPFTLNKNHKRNRVFSGIASEVGLPLAYVNNVGIQDNGKTVFTFDGESCVYDSHGHQVTSLEPFEEGILTVDVPTGRGTFGVPVNLEEDDVSMLSRAVLYGTRQFMRRCGVRKVAVGVSGGIDSALVASLYRHLLDPADLLLVNMPGRYTSPTTRALARGLSERLGCFYTEVPIEPSVRVTAEQLDHLKIRSLTGSMERDLVLSSFVLENVQARDRSSRILAAISASFGGVFTCNANKSEATVGYTTLYGDLGGYLANIADLWKGEVYALARHVNEHVFRDEVIPRGCFDIVPSAELSPAQNVDEGKGDPLIYPYHDCLFRSWVEWWNRATPEEILEWYLEGCLEERLSYSGKVADLFPTARSFVHDLEKWWNQYQCLGVAKRIQAPPVLAVKRRAFGFDHREAQLGARYTRHYLELKERALGGQ